MSEVAEKAKELGQMIISSEAYIELQKAEIRQNNDEEAMKLIADYNAKRGELMKKMQDPNVTPDAMQDVRTQMEDEYKILSANVSIAAYLEATQNFQQLMNEVNGILSYYVNGPEAGSSGCSGDCGGCGGGCH